MSDPRITKTPCGIRVLGSSRVPEGTYVYMLNRECVAVSTAERRAFVAQFGLKETITANFDTVVISQREFDLLHAADGSSSTATKAREASDLNPPVENDPAIPVVNRGGC